MAPRIRIRFDLLDHLADLVYLPPVWGFPGPPLRAIHGPQIPFLIGPGIPNVNIVVREVFDVGVAGKKPEKFMDHAFEEHLPRGHQREALRQVKAQLRPKDAFGPGSSPVPPNGAMIEDVLQKFEVLLHFWSWSK